MELVLTGKPQLISIQDTESFLKSLESNPLQKVLSVELNEGNTEWDYSFKSTSIQVEGSNIIDDTICVLFVYSELGEDLATANVWVDMETREVLEGEVVENNIPSEEYEQPYHYLTA